VRGKKLAAEAGRIFGISPDGGNGSTELMLLLVFVLMAALFAWRLLFGRSSEKA
jgi:hypothetical protein